jgi:hypothetical protein
MRLANVLLGDEEIAPVFATASAQVRPRLRVLPKQGKQLDTYRMEFWQCSGSRFVGSVSL